MKKLSVLFIFLYAFLFSQNFIIPVESNTAELNRLSQIWQERFRQRNGEALERARLLNLPIREEMRDGSFIGLQYFTERGFPVYYITNNALAAQSISTDKVYTGGDAGTNLTGAGITIREWDGAGVLTTHQEYGGRVTQVDSPSETHYHPTHVAGTIMASGVMAAAKGMAFEASLRAFDWDDDVSEMASEAGMGALVSNHSYGWVLGWAQGSWSGDYGWHWMGDPSISATEDFNFGFYNYESQAWDQIAYNAPYYLIVKSAGNDRSDTGPDSGEEYMVHNGSEWVASSIDRDDDGQYDSIGPKSCAKNILTIGATYDVPGGYSNPAGVSMTTFSGWGPTDDGRIKPDISANGYQLYSTFDGSNNDYDSISGTSMSAPSVTGSLALIQEHYSEQTRAYLKAATLKALVIHTADETGTNPGPDYSYGWGLMNTQKAVELINEKGVTSVIEEHSLSNGESFTMPVTALGVEPLEVTICWTDPAGTPVADALDPPTSMLVNDLDLRVTKTGFTGYPWKLNRLSPASAATQNSDNAIDNVEKVYIASPTVSTYTITVTHKGTLSSAQNFSLIVSGAAIDPASISLNPASITKSISANTSSTDEFRITNNGGGTLYYNSEVDFLTREEYNRFSGIAETSSVQIDNSNNQLIDNRSGLDDWNEYANIGELAYVVGDLSERVTLVNPSDFGLSYPFTITKIRNYFYDLGGDNAWEDATYKVIVYAENGSTSLYESAELEALPNPSVSEHILSTPVVITSGTFYFGVRTVDQIMPGDPRSCGKDIGDGNYGNSYYGYAGNWLARPNAEYIQSFYAEGAESWLSITSNQSGTVPGISRDYVDVELLFDSNGLSNGTTKTANINITSNDPYNPSLVVPITMNVQTAPPPDAPINLTITYSGGNVTVNWSAVSGATSYTIYSDTDPEGSFSNVEASGNIPTSWTGTASVPKKFFKVTANN